MRQLCYWLLHCINNREVGEGSRHRHQCLPNNCRAIVSKVNGTKTTIRQVSHENSCARPPSLVPPHPVNPTIPARGWSWTTYPGLSSNIIYFSRYSQPLDHDKSSSPSPPGSLPIPPLPNLALDRRRADPCHMYTHTHTHTSKIWQNDKGRNV